MFADGGDHRLMVEPLREIIAIIRFSSAIFANKRWRIQHPPIDQMECGGTQENTPCFLFFGCHGVYVTQGIYLDNAFSL
jgi:hypothetical protein